MRIIKLDGLRGLFSLMVVLFHFNSDVIPSFLYNNFLIRQSYTFVDFFFVLSGFVISYNYAEKIKSARSLLVFIKKRFIRLYPLLLYTSTILLLYLFSVKIYNHQFSLISKKYYLYKYLDTNLFLNSTPLLGDTTGINYPSWSISAEMVAYLIFGLVLFLFSRTRHYRIFKILLLVTFIFSFVKEEYFFVSNFGFVRACLSFIIGYFVWIISIKKFVIRNSIELFIVPVLLLILYILNSLGGLHRQYFGLFMIPLFFGTSILILLKTNGLLSKLLEMKLFKFFGNISYSIYLNHALIIALFTDLFFKVFKVESNIENQLLVLVFILLILLGYSYLTYLFIEKRGGDVLRKIINRL